MQQLNLQTYPEPGETGVPAVGQKPTGSVRNHGTVSPADAVRYFAARIFEQIETAEIPGQLQMVVKVARPVFKMIQEKLKNLDDQEALNLINGVHSLSVRFEEMTGLENPFVDYD